MTNQWRLWSSYHKFYPVIPPKKQTWQIDHSVSLKNKKIRRFQWIGLREILQINHRFSHEDHGAFRLFFFLIQSIEGFVKPHLHMDDDVSIRRQLLLVHRIVHIDPPRFKSRSRWGPPLGFGCHDVMAPYAGCGVQLEWNKSWGLHQLYTSWAYIYISMWSS